MNELGSQHSPCLTVQLQSLMGKVVCADTWKNTQIEIRTSAWPPQRQPHTLPSLKVKHIHTPTSPPSLSLSLSLSFTTFASLALLSGFTDQWREQLHQRRSGGLEMKRCVAVGKHLATGGGAAEGVGCGGLGGLADVLQVLRLSLRPSSVECWRQKAERWITNVGTGAVCAPKTSPVTRS